MKIRNLLLIVTLSLISLHYSKAQTRALDYKDSSQTITKEELLKEKAANKERISASRIARKQSRLDAIPVQQGDKGTIGSSSKSKKATKVGKKHGK